MVEVGRTDNQMLCKIKHLAMNKYCVIIFCQDLCIMDVILDVDFAWNNLFFFVLLW
jgi:hypothetical protein